MQALRAIAADAPPLAEALRAAGLPVEDLTEAGRSFFALEQDGDILGYGGYEIYGPDALLRSVVVLPDQQGKGYGRALTTAVLDRATRAGANRAFLLTTTAADFFSRQGFVPLSRSDAPPAILATRQAASICATATLLARDLT